MTTPEPQTEDKPKPWFIKPKRTPEQIALEGRSPNRKPRGKRISTRVIDAAQRKQRVINGVAVGKTPGEASMLAGVRYEYAAQQAANDPEFKAALEAAAEEYRRKAAGVIDENLEKVATETVRLSLHAEEEKTRLQGGLALLRGRGVLKDNPVVAIDQSQKQTTVNIIVADSETKNLMEKAKERLLGNGNGPGS